MSRIDCDIIKDLVPSYLDGICSERSREEVEAHIAGCETCSEYVKGLRQTEVVSGGTDLGEMDYMKKVRRHYGKKNVVNFIWIFAVLFTGFIGIRGDYGRIPAIVYEILLPVLAIVPILILRGGREEQGKSIWRMAAGGISLAGICWSGGLAYACINWVESGRIPFGMEMMQIGPFVKRGIMITVVLELCLLVWSLLDSMKKERSCGLIPVFSICGVFWGLAFCGSLYNMDTLEVFAGTLWQLAIVFGIEGIVLGIAAVYASRTMQ